MKPFLLAIFTAFLLGCASDPERKTVWNDITGSNRTNLVLFQDHSSCSLVLQQAQAQAELTNPMPSANSCRTCGALMAATIMLRQQNIDDYANSAYTNCMGAKGWRRQ